MNEELVSRPLHGITVLQLGSAAGYCGRLLSGFGARVLLVEPPLGSSDRREPPFLPGPLDSRSSAVFGFLAVGSNSVVVDVERADGAEVLERLLAVTAICVDSLDWEADSAWVRTARNLVSNSSVPNCRMGPGGELRGVGADDHLVQASSGLMYFSGFPEGPPTPAPTQLAKLQDGLFSAVAVLAMLLNTDAPSLAEVVSQEALAITAVQTANPGYYAWQNVVPQRLGPLGLSGIPYACRDGYVIFTAPAERWAAFRQWVDDENVPAEGLPQSLDGKVETMREALTAARPVIEELAKGRTKQQFYHDAQRRGLICMPVNQLADVLRDEHLAARHFFESSTDGDLELRAPFHSSPEIWRLPARAPALGEHTEAVLAELGYSRDEIECLHGMGAVVCGR